MERWRLGKSAGKKKAEIGGVVDATEVDGDWVRVGKFGWLPKVMRRAASGESAGEDGGEEWVAVLELLPLYRVEQDNAAGVDYYDAPRGSRISPGKVVAKMGTVVAALEVEVSHSLSRPLSRPLSHSLSRPLSRPLLNSHSLALASTRTTPRTPPHVPLQVCATCAPRRTTGREWRRTRANRARVSVSLRSRAGCQWCMTLALCSGR